MISNVNKQTSQTSSCAGVITPVGSSFFVQFGCGIKTISTGQRLIPAVVLTVIASPGLVTVNAYISNVKIMVYTYTTASGMYMAGEPPGVPSRYRGSFQQFADVGITRLVLFDRILSISYEFGMGTGLVAPVASAAAVGNLIFNSTTGEPTEPDMGDDSVVIPNNDMPLNNGARLLHGNEDVPRIFLEALDAAQGQDFGESFFTVYDTKRHRGTFDGLSAKVSPGVFVSQFSVFLYINPVVKGEGVSLGQKFESILSNYDTDLTLEEFTKRMSLYSQSKIILSRMLFHNFDVKYLSSCFNDKFMSTLIKSRFYKFADLYTNEKYGVVGFNEYFRCLCDTGCD